MIREPTSRTEGWLIRLTTPGFILVSAGNGSARTYTPPRAHKFFNFTAVSRVFGTYVCVLSLSHLSLSLSLGARESTRAILLSDFMCARLSPIPNC